MSFFSKEHPRFYISTVDNGATDCTLAIVSGGQRKEFFVESDSWNKLGKLMDELEILMCADTEEDEVPE